MNCDTHPQVKYEENISEHMKKYTKDTDLCITYNKSPPGRANGHAKQRTYENQHHGPHVSLPGKVEPGKLHLGVGRPPGSAEPGQASVQVHLGIE